MRPLNAFSKRVKASQDPLPDIETVTTRRGTCECMRPARTDRPDRPGSPKAIRPAGADRPTPHADRLVWSTLINIILILGAEALATGGPLAPAAPFRILERGP